MSFTTKLILLVWLTGTASMATSHTQNFDSAVNIQQTNIPITFGGTSRNAFADFSTCILAGGNAALVDRGTNNLALRPNQDTKTNGRFSFVLIDASNWGSGTCTLKFDLIGADAGGSRLYVGEAYGFDLSGRTDAAVLIDGFADGFKRGADGNGFGISGINGATANHLVDIDLDGVGGANETVSRPISHKFNISEKATLIVIGFGSYDSGFMIDNIEVIGEAPLATLGLVTG